MAKPTRRAAPWRAHARFVTGAVSPAHLPPADLPEVAFAGRSNVGKSSLLNAVAGLKNLARTSTTPGRTRQLNFFLLEEADTRLCLSLADLPGYGYAKAPKGEVKRWTALFCDYLRGRPNLRRVFLLVDARRGLMTADRDILEMLKEAGVSTQAVLTKCDKLKPDKREGLAEALAEDLKPYVVTHPDVLVTSARTGEGIDDVRRALRTISRH